MGQDSVESPGSGGASPYQRRGYCAILAALALGQS
jgi:hypothetical protein